jgi:hypothetical protein
MKLKIIACKVFFREISMFAAQSKHTIDITWIRLRLHDQPDLLRKAIQDEIDQVESGEDIHTNELWWEESFDAILIAYGLCSNGITGISSTKIPLVVPRAHDCISLFLGSKEKYRKLFDEHPARYWLTPGWVESTSMPGEDKYSSARVKYIEKYGEDNADYLMEIEEKWMSEYDRLTYIKWKSLKADGFLQQAKDSADYLKWDFEEVDGEDGLVRDFVEGNWDVERFLVLQPGESLDQSFDKSVIRRKE